MLRRNLRRTFATRWGAVVTIGKIPLVFLLLSSLLRLHMGAGLGGVRTRLPRLHHAREPPAPIADRPKRRADLSRWTLPMASSPASATM